MIYQIQASETKTRAEGERFNINRNSRELSSSLGTVRLRPKHWQLFNILFDNFNRVISRDQIINTIWEGNIYTGPKGITHSVFNLRSVLKQLDIPLEIKTFHKSGYRLQAITPQSHQNASQFANYV